MVYLPLEKNIQYLGWLVLVHLEQVVYPVVQEPLVLMVLQEQVVHQDQVDLLELLVRVEIVALAVQVDHLDLLGPQEQVEPQGQVGLPEQVEHPVLPVFQVQVV